MRASACPTRISRRSARAATSSRCMLASTIRRRLRGNEVTYVRVADLKVGTTTDGATIEGVAASEIDVVPTFRSADSAGEIRIFQTPHTLDAAIAIVEKARDIAGDTPLCAFCLFE